MNTAAGQQLPLWSGRDAEADWRVRRSVRARRLAVRVFHDGAVEVVVPERTRPREVQSFLARHQDRIVQPPRRPPLLVHQVPPDPLELKAIADAGHMNRGPRCWELVGHSEPQWREFDRELARGWTQVPGWLLAALRTRGARVLEG